MPLEIVRKDITTMQVETIVNDANTGLQMSEGVCGAIYHAAGKSLLQEACNDIGACPVGEAVLTDGFYLPAKKIIHTVGPMWQGGGAKEKEQLENCYKNALALAVTHGYESIAFPLLSTGINGYPKEQALHIAITTISTFLIDHELLVYLVVDDQELFGLNKQQVATISDYIDEHYVEEEITEKYDQSSMLKEDIVRASSINPEEISHRKRSLEDVLDQLGESFSERLLRLIDDKGMTDAETYKKANIDRRLFSKIRNAEHYTPLKKTVIAFAIALELNLDETIDLLKKAGYTLSQSSKFDLIIEYFIEEENYNVHEINEALFHFDQALLGA